MYLISDFIIINNCLEPHIDSADPNYLIRFMETKQTLNKMIKVSFEGYSDSEEYIDNTRIQVEDVFQTHYPDSERKIVKKQEKEFRVTFLGDWTSPDVIDEEVIRDICQSNELTCHIFMDCKMNKSYYYDKQDEFVYP